MNLLKDQHSVQIKTEAFHIFKVFLTHMVQDPTAFEASYKIVKKN
jgi:hypothetical protein